MVTPEGFIGNLVFGGVELTSYCQGRLFRQVHCYQLVKNVFLTVSKRNQFATGR
jgi:hypothetical protein